MKFKITVAELNKIVSTISAVNGGVKDPVVELTLGEKEFNGNVRCLLTCFAGIEQNSSMFYAELPEDYEGSPVMAAFDAKIFLTMAQSLQSMKESVFIETAPGVAYMGIEDTVKLTLPMLARDAVPERLVLDQNKIICQFKVASAELARVIKAGACQVMSVPDSNGLDNAVVVIMENSMKVYSTDGKAIAMAACGITKSSVTYRINEAGEKEPVDLKLAEENYCKEKSLDQMMIAVPKKVINDIAKLIGAAEEVAVCLTDRHVFLAPEPTAFYVGCLGANVFRGVVKMGSLKNSEIKAAAVVDADTVKSSLDLLEKCSSAAGRKSAVKFTIRSGAPLKMESGEGNNSVNVNTIETDVNDEASKFLDGKRVMDIFSVMDKGNLRIAFPENEKYPIVFCNGSIAAESENSPWLLLSPISRVDVAKDEADEPSEADTSEQENVDAGEKS